LTGKILKCCGVDYLEEILIENIDDIMNLSSMFTHDTRLIAKISSPDIPHKTDV
jgi:hypothetical protein